MLAPLTYKTEVEASQRAELVTGGFVYATRGLALYLIT